MKKYFVILAATVVTVAACNSGSGSSSADSSASSTPTEKKDNTSNPDYQAGLKLVAANDCFTCHKIDEKVTGPAYQDVAAKYENTDANVKMLADKIIKGGSGVWGPAAMTPHTGLSEADAEQMVKYILLLKK